MVLGTYFSMTENARKWPPMASCEYLRSPPILYGSGWECSSVRNHRQQPAMLPIRRDPTGNDYDVDHARETCLR